MVLIGAERIRAMPPYQIRPGRPGDGPAAHHVLHAAVHQGAAAFYSAAERAAWAPDGPPAPDWEARLLSGHTLVAEDRAGAMIGFMTLGHDGFLDFAYVAPGWMGKGVGDALYAALEPIARAAGMRVLSTEASHLARRFFHRHGWATVARQSVIRDGVAITNFRMECPLP
ncbi:MAG: GNAT family N-acetyltransferase [Confluentimicrobium sp.]|nr:GNAT family N-acetyltransferase [Actibacterium sp.]